MAIDAWSGAIGAVGAATIAGVVGLYLKFREAKREVAKERAAKEEKDSTSVGEAAKTLETAFEKSELRNEKWAEKYEKVLERVAALDTKVALQDQKIEAQDQKMTLMQSQLDGKDADLRLCHEEKQQAINRALRAEADNEIYRVGLESLGVMLEKSNGDRVDEAIVAVAGENLEKAKRLAEQNTPAGRHKSQPAAA